MLPAPPLGTILGAVGLWLLFRPKEAVSPAPALGLIGFGLCAAGVAAGFVVVLGAGFRLSGDAAPEPVASAFWPAAAILVLCLSAAAAFATRGVRSRVEAQQLAGDTPVEYRRWQAAQRDYDEDPSRLATCEDLQPIEAEMRRSGVLVTLQVDRYLRAACRIDGPALAQRFALAPSVAYSEHMEPDRGGFDVPAAHIACSRHLSAITTLHPDEAPAGTASFPA
ncbi:hypothetical protein [Phenylobacterium sp.]|jgi:hypothetical protein|uniref:hypothetical protein n=1 Tax=Phenylobacterium sp. TaxID=1871053 RepID=UPI002E36AC96|nr:hypothetical protein [Phenylobacterium sp.]HEX2558560.1 hypothetical protein [Phenylobacterium sp.]